MPYDANGYPEATVPDLGRIFQAIRDRNCIPFFGAGASMGYAFNGTSAPGICSGWDLTLSLLREAHVATDVQIAALKEPSTAEPIALRDALKLQGFDLFKAADAFLFSRSNNRTKLDEFLRQEISKAKDPRPIHTVISQVEDIFTVLTTNYDCLFEAACKHYKRVVFKHVHEQTKANSGAWPCRANLKKPEVILHKMHGCEERDGSMIITRADYIRYLANWKDPAKGMPSCVSTRLPGSTLLFLGYGLADWNFLTIWEGVVSTSPQGGDDTQSFAVMRSVSQQDRHFFQKKNIEVIECDLTDFAVALAKEFKLEIPQLGIPKQQNLAGGAA